MMEFTAKVKVCHGWSSHWVFDALGEFIRSCDPWVAIARMENGEFSLVLLRAINQHYSQRRGVFYSIHYLHLEEEHGMVGSVYIDAGFSYANIELLYQVPEEIPF
jgi:hypothetical protein